MIKNRNRAGRLLALVLALTMLVSALPATATSKKTPEDVFNQWFALQDKWMVALEESRFADDELNGLIEDIYYKSSMGSAFTMLNLAVAGVVFDEIGGDKDGTYKLEEDFDDAKVTKEEGKYVISFKDGKDSFKVSYSENTGSFHAQCNITSDEKMTLYSDIIPTQGGMYTSLVVAVKGEEAVSITQYMRDSLVYFTYTVLDEKEDPADYRLLKAPDQYGKLKSKNGAAITLTDSGRLTLEYKEFKEHFQSK